MNVILCGREKGFGRCDSVKDLGWGDHLGLSGWVLRAVPNILIKERHRET